MPKGLQATFDHFSLWYFLTRCTELKVKTLKLCTCLSHSEEAKICRNRFLLVCDFPGTRAATLFTARPWWTRACSESTLHHLDPTSSMTIRKALLLEDYTCTV